MDVATSLQMRKVFSHAEWGYLYVNIGIFALPITSFLGWKFM